MGGVISPFSGISLTGTLTNASFDAHTAGYGLAVANGGSEGGTNAKIGTGSLNSGVATVTNTSVTANSYIFLSPFLGTSTGALSVATVTPSTSFVATSSSATDTSRFNYFIVEPG